MVNHVKLEIAIQIAAEKISELYKKLENAIDENQKIAIQSELDEAFEEKEMVAAGNADAIEKILNERGNR